MKKLISFVIAVIVFTSCATTKTSKVEVTPAGTYAYSITNTPEGDFSGDFIITSQDKNYTAKLNAAGNELKFNTCAWDQTNNKVTGDFIYSGYNVYFEATLNGEELTGSVSAEGESFPFKATRKK
jgi:hypothetical protein